MTQEDKDLIVKDLCARLPYGVKINLHNTIFEVDFIEKQDSHNVYVGLKENDEQVSQQTNILNIKTYLRPLSSMTEEEKKEIGELLDASIEIDTDGNISYFSSNDFIPCSDYQIYIDYLISHHFDYRGLIPMGLALKAPEGMYK